MIKLEEYIKLPITERKLHLKLEEPCLERGGNSTNHRGVLAQYLNTWVSAKGVVLAHACNNGNCSNPNHLYWGNTEKIQLKMELNSELGNHLGNEWLKNMAMKKRVK